MLLPTVTLDELTGSQYWTGHGHSHEPDNLLACIVVAVSPERTDTVNDFVEKFMDIFKTKEWFITDTTDYTETEQRLDNENAIIELLVEKELRLAIAEEPTERIYNQDEPFAVDVYFYGWVHVYEVVEE